MWIKYSKLNEMNCKINNRIQFILLLPLGKIDKTTAEVKR